MNNYEFCADYAARKLARGGKMLDYGCGDGTIVKLARAKGVEAYGCDVFYGGGDYSTLIEPDAFGKTIFRMVDGKIPFADGEFDLVINNQVLEHAEDLDQVVSEMSRVLKPGGTVLSLFPDHGVWREGHCGVPFLHWFPKGSRFRVNYAHAFRLAGLGVDFPLSSRPWAEHMCRWLDEWTYYRSYGEIRKTFERYLSTPHHLEAEWFELRMDSRGRMIPKAIGSMIARKWAHLTFEAKKPD